ncbi:MAG: DUF4886 domain-containing protein [Candidatus Cryptobacteroides sp.]
MKRFTAILLAMLLAATSFAAKRGTLRILAIGNSFSEDAVEQNLADLARADGRCAIIGNLYIGGCPLSRHWENVKGDKAAYRFRTIDAEGVMTTHKNYKISDAVRLMKWDVVTLQQSSPLSGKIESYEPYMQELVGWLRENVPSGTKLMFYQTWAYSRNAVRKEFENYGRDQKVMYDSIMVATRKICDRYALDVIPAGTAVQNGRSTSIRDNFCRDGYHLSHSCGRYTAACTWYEAIFGRPVRGNLYRPSHMTAEQAIICQSAASAAVTSPFSTTDCGFRKPNGNFDEGRVPEYVLPDALLSEDGRKMTSARAWEKTRRGELLDIFTREVFGRAPQTPDFMQFEVLEVKEGALDGLATRKRVAVRLDSKDRVKMELLVYTPASVPSAPVFLGINFFGNHTITSETDIPMPSADDLKRYGEYETAARGEYAYRWPLEMILKAGYGVATFSRADIQPDFDTSTKGIRSVYPQDYGPVCGPDQWGAIAAWAWGLSRAMDYLCTDKDVDASRVALIGHSRLAKTALWAGAVDTRFAMVIANESGCGGAAISRRAYGETVGIINRSFPHWFCDNFKKYSENEAALPIDQHELLALIAPRPLCIGSARGDRWSDPTGERLAAEAALVVYDLYGKDASSRVSYHIRDGRHEIYPEDWEAYLNFAGRFL